MTATRESGDEVIALDAARARIAELEMQVAAERSEAQRHLRNVLATIRSLARRTAADATSAEDYQSLLDGRLAAFARVQAAVAREPAAGVELGAAIGDELLPFDVHIGKGATIEGPPCALSPRAAGLVSLLVHELAAALEDGTQLDVRWQADPERGLELTWRASGARARRDLTFARELIGQAIPFEVKGSGQIESEGGAVIVTLSLPATCFRQG